MMPFVGSRYRDDIHKRLLVIAESHYLPDCSTIHLDPERWYGSSEENLTDEERGYVHTQEVLVNYWDGPARGLFFKKIREQVSRSLAEHGVEEERQRPGNFAHVAFCNYFQRPAPNTGGSMQGHVRERDRQVADEVLRWFIRIHAPQLIVIVSTFSSWHAKRTIEEYGIPWVRTPHPNCAWWNRSAKAYGGRIGHELFADFLREQQWITSR